LILLVTEPRYGDDAICEAAFDVAAALPAGAFAVQLRDKARDPSAIAPLARRLRAITRDRKVPLYINGYVGLAREVEADGVHLGAAAAKAGSIAGARALFPFVSVAAHSDDDVLRARDAGATAVLVSPIFATPGKGAPRGVAAVKTARSVAPPPFAIFALGGIDATNARACADAGADGVAVIRAILGAGPTKYAAAARRFHEAWHLARAG
jgi:thiamine-phosphate pyrophosphorylase